MSYLPERVQSATPTTGQTVSMANTDEDIFLVLAPAGTLAALTINLPNDATSRVGQRVTMYCSQVVTSLTVQNASGIMNNVLAFALGDLIQFRKVAANTWARLIT